MSVLLPARRRRTPEEAACRAASGLEPRAAGDLVVVEVVAVAEDDRGALLRRKRRRQLGELHEGRPPVLVGQLRHLALRPGATVDVERDVAGDRDHPGAQVRAVLETSVGAQRAQERLLERVVGTVAAELAAQDAEHLVAVLGVEPLERRDRRHGLHHHGKRRQRSPCEVVVTASRREGGERSAQDRHEAVTDRCEGARLGSAAGGGTGSPTRSRSERESPARRSGRLPGCASQSSGTSSGSASAWSTSHRAAARSRTRPTTGRRRAAPARSRPCSSRCSPTRHTSSRPSATTSSAGARGRS